MTTYKASTTFTETDITTLINFSTIPVFADNTSAITGGLIAGQLYRTATGEPRIVI